MTTHEARKNESCKLSRERNRLFLVLVIVLLLIFTGLVLYKLGFPLVRDYDEGVYWQTLRWMSRGNALYESVFYSQPPAFLPAIYPVFVVFGKTLFAARLGVALISFLGLLGAALTAKVILGKPGVLIALLLLVLNPFFISASRTLQADAPVTSLMLLTVGLAYSWWSHPSGSLGYILAVLTAVALDWSIFCKLFGLAAAVPVALLALAHMQRAWREPTGRRLAHCGSLLAGIVALILVALLVLFPFRTAFPHLWDQVISFHLVAKGIIANPLIMNLRILNDFCLQSPLVLLAVAGSGVALLHRDWLVLPLLAWLLAVAALLLQQAPLFPHHLVTLVAPVTLLSIPVIKPLLTTFSIQSSRSSIKHFTIALVLVFAVVYSLTELVKAFREMDPIPGSDLQISRDLAAATKPGQNVITDAQFLAALIDRYPPPFFVDTSLVRIRSGYLRSEQLIIEAQASQVSAILFYRYHDEKQSRLARVPGFKAWVASNYHLQGDYGVDGELWIKK